MHRLTDAALTRQASRLTTFAKIAFTSLLLACGIAFTAPAHAAMTFTASTTTGAGKIDTVLSWAAAAGSVCTASGHPSWTGTKAATSPAGGFKLPTITLSGTYKLTLACTLAGNAATTVLWTNPTTNTDGTPLTNFAGVRINYGRTATTTDTVKLTESATATSASMGNLAVGDWFFVLRAYNTLGFESDPSATVKKTVVAGVSESNVITLTVNPVPGVPTDVTVQQLPE